MNYIVPNQSWVVTEMLNAGRILSKGKITIANNAFSLPNYVPFSLFLVPKSGVEDIWQIINVSLQQDNSLTPSPLPFNIGCWTEASVAIATIDSTLLSKYDIFWGAGQKVEVA